MNVEYQYPENSPDPGHIDQQELRVAQQDDPAIGPVMGWKLSGRKPSAAERQKELHETNALMFDWKKLEINKGILLRKTAKNKEVMGLTTMLFFTLTLMEMQLHIC